MWGNKKSVAGAVFGTLVSLSAVAAADAPLTASDRAAIVKTLASTMNANYIEPAVAARTGSAIARKDAGGGYASYASAQAFAAALAQDLRDFSGDRHFGARLDDPRRAGVPRRAGNGIEKVERLPGNVGYIELRSFEPRDTIGAAYGAAMSLLAGTDALILDLRRNGGGDPASVAYLVSHFFPPGDKRHLIDIYDRPTNTTREIWTVPSVTQRYDKPVYVLTSAGTFSGGEDCAYDFQTQKRGTVVGILFTR